MSTGRYIDIPGDVLDVYRLWHPSPLFGRLGENAGYARQDFYKYEGVIRRGRTNPYCGASGLVQCQEGVRKLTTETEPGNGEAHWHCLRPIWTECEIWQVTQVTSQTAPTHHDGNLGREGASQPFEVTEFGRKLL